MGEEGYMLCLGVETDGEEEYVRVGASYEHVGDNGKPESIVNHMSHALRILGLHFFVREEQELEQHGETMDEDTEIESLFECGPDSTSHINSPSNYIENIGENEHTTEYTTE